MPRYPPPSEEGLGDWGALPPLHVGLFCFPLLASAPLLKRLGALTWEIGFVWEGHLSDKSASIWGVCVVGSRSDMGRDTLDQFLFPLPALTNVSRM